MWGAVIGPPAFLKSPALRAALGPLNNLEKSAQEARENAQSTVQFDKKAAEIHLKAIEGPLRQAYEKNDHVKIERLRDQYRAANVESKGPITRRYIIQDATVEKVGELLKENSNGLCLFRDELSGFLATMDRPGHENDRAFYCEAWSGDGSYIYDRIGRGTVHIESCCLSIVGGIQPGPLEAYLRESLGGSRADGLMQRFQLAVYPNFPWTYTNIDRKADRKLQEQIYLLFKQLNAAKIRGLKLIRSLEEKLFVHFAEDAQPRFD